MKNINIQYQELLQDILENGYQYTDKKRDVECLQIDSATLHIDLRDGFPALTTKELYWKGVVGELLWFLRGSTDIRELWKDNIHIWDKDWWRYEGVQDEFSVDWTLEKVIKAFKEDRLTSKLHNDLFDVGRIYGAQWRDWTGVGIFTNSVTDYTATYPVDQISDLIKGMREQPMSRRHIVNAWNPAELDDMALPPCHWSFECIVRPIETRVDRWKKQLSKKEFESKFPNYKPSYGFTLKWHQRSVDTFLGLPFNIASYALLAHIIGKLTNMQPLGLIGDLSNVHLYENAWEASRELIERDPIKHSLPKLEDFTGFKMDMYGDFNQWINSREITDFKLEGYQAYPNDFNVKMLAPK